MVYFYVFSNGEAIHLKWLTTICSPSHKIGLSFNLLRTNAGVGIIREIWVATWNCSEVSRGRWPGHNMNDYGILRARNWIPFE